ncbi:MAG: type II secretion system major pseudopilin GspG [Maricaulaceae bacterium]|jgi:general secretion pathway protein G
MQPFFPMIANAERRRRRADRTSEAGVTLLEMIVVLVIIAIVASLVAPQVMGRPGEARATVARANLQTIAGALQMYRLDNQVYPTTAQGLEALVTRPSIGPAPTNWHAEGYFDRSLLDPWGNPYVYRSPGETGQFDLISLGADGAPGGEGLDADISHRSAP